MPTLAKVVNIAARQGLTPPHRKRKALDLRARRKKVATILRKLDRDAELMERQLNDLKQMIFSLRGELNIAG